METCTNPDILKVILFVKSLINVIRFIVPIGLILFLSFDFFKNVIANKEDDIKKNVSTAIKRLLYAAIIFLIPTVVNFIMIILGDIGVPYADCITNADISYINTRIVSLAESAYETAKNTPTAANITAADNYISQITDTKKRQELQSAMKVIKNSLTEEIQHQLEEEQETAQIQLQTGDNNNTEILSNGTEGNYFAPLQDKSKYSLSGYSIGYTAGCANNAYHDVSVSEKTPIYAPFDGKAKYYQKYCSSNGLLYSYGNMIEVTASDNTYIIYAHLHDFPSKVSSSSKVTPIPTSKSCPKTGGPPCPASSCTAGMKTLDIATVSVKKGELIGYTGDTGNSTGPHLHVEIHEKGSSYCRSDPWKAFGMR